LINHESVVLVSPAPVFGVKLIEVVQKLFTMAGKPLLVDAENWMAHRGTANVILNSATMIAYNLMLTGKQHPPIFADQ
jgi:hypothetical protein